MKKRNFLTNILFLVVSLLFVVYMGYHAYSAATNKTEVIEAISVSAVDKLSLEGVFIRNQIPLDWKQTEMTELFVSNGTRVSKGQTVAYMFTDESSKERYSSYKDAERKLETLKGNSSLVTDSADGAKLSLLVKEAVTQYSDAIIQGDVEKIDESTSKMTSLISLQKSNGSTKDQYQAEVAALESQLRSYNFGGSNNSVKSTASGYFFSKNDGFDPSLSADNIDSITCDTVMSALSNEANYMDSSQGKLVTDFEWFFAVVLDDAQAKKTKQYNNVTLTFSRLSGEAVPATLVRLTNEGTDKNIAIFKSTYMRAAMLETRVQTCEIILDNYEGLKVPKSAIRQEKGQWGVYCLSNDKAVFKPVEWVFETENFYIVKQAQSPTDGLFEYDKIIISSKLIEK